MSETKQEDQDNSELCCCVPQVKPREFSTDVDPNRARLIVLTREKWFNGRELTYYYFREGDFSGLAGVNIPFVEKGFQGWRELGIGITFREVSDINDAILRIGFLAKDGSWSYVGRDANLNRPPRTRTMNFGWDLNTDSRGGGVDTPLHEIGHALGFQHEQQNPIGGIQWDVAAVMRRYRGPPNNWNDAQIRTNILRKLDPNEVTGSTYDSNSIMHYGFPSGLIISPPELAKGVFPEDGLSAKDKKTVLDLYPPIKEEETNVLSPSKKVRLDTIPNGGDLIYSIKINSSGNYNIATTGPVDTLLELHEKRTNGTFTMVARDDDSGTGRNASIEVDLMRGNDYELRIRKFWIWESGSGASLEMTALS